MTDAEFLEMLEQSISDGQKLVVSHGWAKDLIRLARKGLVDEKTEEALERAKFLIDVRLGMHLKEITRARNNDWPWSSFNDEDSWTAQYRQEWLDEYTGEP